MNYEQLGCVFVASIVFSLSSGCTSTINLAANNETDYPLVLSATLLDGQNDKNGFVIHQEGINSGEKIPQKKIGKGDKKKYVEIKASLKDGAVVKKLITNLQTDPTNTDIKISKSDIQAEEIKITDTATIESQIIDIKGSYQTPTTDISSLLSQYIGGIYTKTEKDGVIRFDRIYTLYELYGDTIKLKDFIPQSTIKGQFELSAVANQSNSAQLQAQFPGFNLNTNFGASELYNYRFNVQGSSWHGLRFTWYSVERKLRSTNDGIEILRDLVEKQRKEGNLYFLTEAFVFEDASVETYKAETIGIGTDISYKDFIHAQGAYKWTKDSSNKQQSKNFVFRVKYQTLSPINATTLVSTDAPLKVDPNQNVEYKAIAP